MSDTVSETARLRLRSWRDSDIEPYLATCNTPAVARHVGGVTSREKVEAAIERLRACEARHGFTFWVLERRADDAFLGYCGLEHVFPEVTPPALHDVVEIGWRLREDVWRQGYAREAAEQSLRLGFGRFGLSRIAAMTKPVNKPSWGLMIRLGMRARPDLDFDMPEHGPHVVYLLEDHEWTASRSSS